MWVDLGLQISQLSVLNMILHNKLIFLQSALYFHGLTKLNDILSYGNDHLVKCVSNNAYLII